MTSLMQSTLFTFVLLIQLLIQKSSSFISNNFLAHKITFRSTFNGKTTFATSNNIDSTTLATENANYDTIYQIKAIASAGLDDKELETIFSILSKSCSSLNDDIDDSATITFNIQNENGIQHVKNKPAIPNNMPGVTGRIVLLTTQIITNNEINDNEYQDDDEWLHALQYKISEYMDPILFNNNGNENLNQPVLLCYRNNDDDIISFINEKIEQNEEKSIIDLLSFLVEEEVEQYELCAPLSELQSDDDDDKIGIEQFVPSSWVEIDGAWIEYNEKKCFDTSTIMVFDQLVDDELRQGLLNVILGKDGDGDGDGDDWDDIENGPDPSRWVYGGLSDVPDDEGETICTSISRGLSTEATMDLCYNENHKPIAELESLLTKLFSKDIIVTKLPEAMLGSSVSPITANAPIYNETFDYHIDADPNLCPPSTWTDIYDTYPNRTPGKPRFMSFLIYLNDYWDDDFGAATKFLDPVTKDVHEVIPKPGRCVLMDQDILHTVTAPTVMAGLKRPRYSIVWKLILHPTKINQDMKNGILSLNDDDENSAIGERKVHECPKPTFIGSAVSTTPT